MPLGALLVAVILSGTLAALRPISVSAQSEERGAARRESAINRAYVEIKKRRKAALDTYLADLKAAVEKCVEDRLSRPGLELLDTIERLVEPPDERRKIQEIAGVGLDATGQRIVRELARSREKRGEPEKVDPELQKEREWIAERRDNLSVGALDISDSPESDTDADAEVTEKKRAPATAAEAAIYRMEKRARSKFIRSIRKLAELCLANNFPAHAYELLLWALRVDGDNLKLRAVVRQHKFVDEEGVTHWYSPYEMQKVQAGYREHPEFGWVKPSELEALKAGKVWYKGQWLDRDYVERERQKWENAWKYETEHFLITTNAPLADAVEFGREVERLYAFFFRQFVDFYAGHPSVKLVFQGGMDLRGKKLELHYYRSREHYLENIKKDPILTQVPNFELTLRSAGFYYKGTGKAYFFRGPTGPDLSVIYHEVTHQVFGQTYNTGPRPPVWLVEGFAVFMEDPIVREERLIAGAEPPPGIRWGESSVRDINRFMASTQLDEGFHGAGRGDNYATAGAVVHFFLLYEGGIFRRGFMRYAREAYRNSGENTPTHVSKLYEYIGISEEELQKRWEEFNKDPDLFDF